MKKIISLFLFCLVSACVNFGTSQPSKFYSLQVIKNIASISNKKISVGVEEVQIPEYLDKPQIVTVKEGSVEMNLSEINRWSEDLSTMMQRTVAEDINLYLPQAMVKSRTLGRESFDYTVFIEVSKFEGDLGKEARLDAWWYILDRNGDMIVREKTSVSIPVPESDYDSLVRAESTLVGQLSEQIALKLAKRPR